jgi:hypothetical protein
VRQPVVKIKDDEKIFNISKCGFFFVLGKCSKEWLHIMLLADDLGQE